MGCHSSLGVTIDQTFSLARKIPGIEGWRHQDLHGQRDQAIWGHPEPEVLTYLKRVGGGDELRANDEMLARFFRDGRVDEALVRRLGAGPDGLAALVVPSIERARALNKSYLVLVRRQSFTLGRDSMPAPAGNVHKSIGEDDAAFDDLGRIFRDGRLTMLW